MLQTCALLKQLLWPYVTNLVSEPVISIRISTQFQAGFFVAISVKKRKYVTVQALIRMTIKENG